MSGHCDVPSADNAYAAGAFPNPHQDAPLQPGRARAVVAGGCFWCVEAVYLALDGVISVTSGYAGGSAETANYDAVCSGHTEHAEAIEIVYDTARISFGQILKIFFSVAHDPTQLNRQGNDRGRQYRSAIFFADEQQRDIASAYIAQLDVAGVFSQPIVTELEPLQAFYPAEAYHQNYAAQHPWEPYIMAVAAPKVEKLHNLYPDAIRKSNEEGGV